MSTSRSSRCLFCTFTRTAHPRQPPTRRKFHCSPVQLANRKPRHPNIKAEDLVKNIRTADPKKPAEAGGAAETYTDEQYAAIQAARDLLPGKKDIERSGVRTDPWSMNYYDDLTEIDPVVDNPIRAPWSNTDPNSQLKSDEEISDELAKFIADFPLDEKEQASAWSTFEKNLRLTNGREEAERNPRTAMAPDIPPQEEEKPKSKKTRSTDPRGEEEEPSPALVRLMQMTGYDRRQIAALRVKSIITHRVVNQTRLGKIGKVYILTIAGNGQGLIGIGEGKSEEAGEARLQSQYRAIRNMQPILRYENRTIFGDVKGKVSATELELYARPPGFGLRCQQYIWEICKCAGISDLAARVTRARNPMNTVKATVAALLSQKDPEDIARARGKKLVDVRKVYYAGLV